MKNVQEPYGKFLRSSVLFRLFMYPLNVNRASSEYNVNCVSRRWVKTEIGENACSTKFLVHSMEAEDHVQLLFWWVVTLNIWLQRELYFLTFYTEGPSDINDCFILLPIQHQYHKRFLRLVHVFPRILLFVLNTVPIGTDLRHCPVNFHFVTVQDT